MLHCVTKLGVVRHCLSTNIIYCCVDPSPPIACIVVQGNILRPVAVAMADNFTEQAKVYPDTGNCVLI